MGSCTGAKVFFPILGLCFTFAAGCLMYAAIIVFSGYQIEYDKIYSDYHIWAPGAIILTASVFMFILGVIACCAAYSENNCLLACFFTILIIIVILELTGGTAAIVYKGEVKDEIINGIRKAFNEYGMDTSEGVTESIDIVQETLQCCGVENSTNWSTTPWGILHPGQVPKSCCKKDKSGCIGSVFDILLGNIYTVGCYNIVEKKLEAHLNKIIGASSGLLGIQVIGLIFSCVFKP